MKKTKKAIKEHLLKLFRSPRFGIVSKIALVIACLVLPLAIIEKREIWTFTYHFNPFSIDDYRWLLSAVAQSMAALFGIGGMFTAYILQIFNNRIRESEAEARNILVEWGHKEFVSLSGKEFIIKLAEYNEKPKPDGQRLLMENGFLTLKKAEKDISINRVFKKITISGARDLAVFMSFIICLSLLALPFSAYLSELFSGFIFLVLILFLIIIFLYKLGRFILVAVLG
jgi:hypothetical protein